MIDAAKKMADAVSWRGSCSWSAAARDGWEDCKIAVFDKVKKQEQACRGEALAGWQICDGLCR